MLLRDSTYELQASLASYCRTGDDPQISGVTTGRISHYRRLVFNIIEDNLQTAYPLTYALLSQVEWEEVVNEFFRNHPCQSPQIWSMPKEFYEYLQKINHPLLQRYPFLEDLLLFEWKEIELYMSEDIPVPYSTEGDAGKDPFVLNPEHDLLHLSWPVHITNASEIEADRQGNYFLLMHRDPGSGKIIFTNLSPAFVRIIEYLIEKPESIGSMLKKINREMKVEITDEVMDATRNFILNGLENRLILGFETTAKKL